MRSELTAILLERLHSACFLILRLVRGSRFLGVRLSRLSRFLGWHVWEVGKRLLAVFVLLARFLCGPVLACRVLFPI